MVASSSVLNAIYIWTNHSVASVSPAWLAVCATKKFRKVAILVNVAGRAGSSGRNPVVHQLCFELPEEIQIAYRPHCLLVFEECRYYYYYYCEYCNQNNERYKYICGDCDFQICLGCVSKLVKYHEGRTPQVKHFSHRHSLTSLSLDDMNCKFCNEKIDGEACGCAPCEFYIHNSCRDELSEEIEHHFHPKHSLAFKDYTPNPIKKEEEEEVVSEEEENLCDACRYEMQGLGYRCHTCNFNLHLKCTTLKANIKYPGHGHHLILVEKFDHKSICEACGLNIKGVFFLRCVECLFDFHLQCDPIHPLPPTVLQHKDRLEHPLLHINEQELAKEDDSQLLSCNVCGEERNPEDPFYRCAKGESIVAHVRCVITEVQRYNRRKLKHFSDEYDIHNSDGSWRQEIWHPFHPRHSLKLLDDKKITLCCKACPFNIRGLRY